MHILFIIRSTWQTLKGGDTVQVLETAEALRQQGIAVTICPADQDPDYKAYDLLHFFNIIRPADILYHIKKTQKPYVISSIFIDYSVYDKYHRGGLAVALFRLLSADGIEYIKSIGRFITGKDKLRSLRYLFMGQKRSIRYVLSKAQRLIVQTDSEYKALRERYGIDCSFAIIPNGINPAIFKENPGREREPGLVICAARIEGLKNQLNLIKALNDSAFKLVLIGDPAPGQLKYYEQCKNAASSNVHFVGHIPQKELSDWYTRATVHILPSYFEVCGLSSLEAAAMGCNIVITNGGFAKDYFGDQAFYCDPTQPESIRNAVEAAAMDTQKSSYEELINKYNWSTVAEKMKQIYRSL